MQKKTKEGKKDLAKQAEVFKNVATKHDISEVRYDISEVRHDISGIKTELGEFKNETTTRLDKIIATQERHEQERIFAYEQTRRHEGQIDKHNEEIKEIKALLKVR